MEYVQFLRKLRADDLTPVEAMARLPEWGKADDDTKHLTIWDEWDQIDWSKDAEMVAGWFAEGLKELGKVPDVDMVGIGLGDCPEVFSMDGYRFSSGQEKIGELIEMLRMEDEEPWVDELDWDNIEELAYEATKELPSGWWDWYMKCTRSGASKTRVNADLFYILWEVLANQTVTHVLRHGNLDFASIVGDRAKVPIIIGFEDAQWYIGSLIPEGWQEP